VPTDIPEELEQLFRRYNHALDTGGLFGTGVLRLECEICGYLKGCQKKVIDWELAEQEGWPINIDFKKLPDRIIAMEDKLRTFIIEEGLEASNLVVQALRTDLSRVGLELHKLVTISMPPVIIVDHAWPG
jgi:hypothetical protein